MNDRYVPEAEVKECILKVSYRESRLSDFIDHRLFIDQTNRCLSVRLLELSFIYFMKIETSLSPSKTASTANRSV